MFDFNDKPVHVYGIWPQTPFPVEVSIYGYCRMSCSFCFANRNREAAGQGLRPKNSAPALLRKLDRAMADEHDPLGFFLREGYPVCFSNTTDPFQRDETTYRASETFLAWCQANRVPVYLQTRGNVLWQEWDRYAPLLEPGRVVAYVSLCQLDDKLRRRHEPGALPLPERWALVRRLSDRGVPVVAACNPYLKDWVPDPDAYCRLAAGHGARGVWLEALHLTGAQANVLPLTYRDDVLMKANLQPMYLIGQLKEWYKATARHGLDFFPCPRWDGYFGHKAAHPECADPAWLGGKTLDFNFRLLKAVSRLSEAEGGALVAFGWPEVKACLDALGVPNPRLSTEPFWYPYNAAVKADYSAWRARLGRRAPFHEIVRYFWNHPWENQHLVWYHPLVQAAREGTDPDGSPVYADGTGEGDLVALFNPKIKHHGSFYADCDAVDWGRVSWPIFQPPAEGEGEPCQEAGAV